MALEPPGPQAIVIFGVTGDLSRRKILPALYNLSREGLLPERHAVVGYARSDLGDDGLRALARDAIREHVADPLDEDALRRLEGSLIHVRGSFDERDGYERLATTLDRLDASGCDAGRLYYLATPPEYFATIAEGIGAVGQGTGRSRIVVEKPFGHSLASARELTERLHGVFDETRIFRIDHYLGKETVQNIVILRFGNSTFERLWNRDVIDHVQLTVAESLGAEGRADYYDAAGATRDLLQNHILQVLSFLTMEPPRSLEPEALRDEKVKVLRTMRPIDPTETVRGQYVGYRDEPGVDPASETETFVAARLHIDNWRWEDVPFFVRHGKRLTRRATEIDIEFRGAPDYLFGELDMPKLAADHLTIRIQPDEGISLAFQAKRPGPGYELQTVRMDFDYERSFMHEPAEAYERLLHDAMGGDHTLFTRADGVERAWEVVTPMLEHPGPLCTYEPGSWGPAESDDLIAPRRWHVRGGP
ncbi:MAG TPA: glucose-6-phosphate dehydrogenase [Actinomycetota bacterium]|nr:glucose-6-phosphate dehydrogenase [Actinomycetota bacterium]